MTTFDDAQQDVERLREQVKKAVLVRDRLLLLKIVDEIGDLPEDGFIATVTWPEDPNIDGTFDVTLESVRNAKGQLVADLSDIGGLPVGSYTAPLSSSWDVFRVDRYDVESLLSVEAIRSFQEAMRVTG